MSGFTVPGDMALNATETDCVFVEGVSAVAQQIRIGLQVFSNTWHYDRNAGIAYIDKVFANNPDLRGIRVIFWDFLSGVPGVAEVETLSLRVDSATRTLFVSFVIRTEYGTSVSDTVALIFPA